MHGKILAAATLVAFGMHWLLSWTHGLAAHWGITVNFDQGHFATSLAAAVSLLAASVAHHAHKRSVAARQETAHVAANAAAASVLGAPSAPPAPQALTTGPMTGSAPGLVSYRTVETSTPAATPKHPRATFHDFREFAANLNAADATTSRWPWISRKEKWLHIQAKAKIYALAELEKIDPQTRKRIAMIGVAQSGPDGIMAIHLNPSGHDEALKQGLYRLDVEVDARENEHAIFQVV